MLQNMQGGSTLRIQHQRPMFKRCHNDVPQGWWAHKGMSACHTRCDLEDNGTYNPAPQSKPIAPRGATLAEHMCPRCTRRHRQFWWDYAQLLPPKCFCDRTLLWHHCPYIYREDNISGADNGSRRWSMGQCTSAGLTAWHPTTAFNDCDPMKFYQQSVGLS